MNFDFNADLDQALHCNTDHPDPDPASQNNADPCVSGTATLLSAYSYTVKTLDVEFRTYNRMTQDQTVN